MLLWTSSYLENEFLVHESHRNFWSFVNVSEKVASLASLLDAAKYTSHCDFNYWNSLKDNVHKQL